MKRATQTADRQFKAIESRAAGMSAKLSGAFKDFGLGMAGGLAGGFAAALAPMALFQKALETINDASHLVDTADKLGITTTALQELGFGFSQAGVEASDFETGLDQFTKRIGEAATRGGRLADILKANGVAIRDSNGQIRSSESLLSDYADLMKNAATEQERMVLATEAFGRGGAGFTVALKDGAAGIDNMKRAAAEAGGVIDEELLRRAEELGDRWEAAWRRFKVNSQSAILTAIQGLDDLNDRMKRFLEARNAVEGGALAGSLAGTKPTGKAGRLGSVDERINQAFLGELVKADDALIEQLRKRYAKTTIIPATGGSGGGGSDKPKDTFKATADGFAEMLGATDEWREAQRIANDQLEHFGDLAVDAGNALVGALADGKIEGQELLGIISSIVTQLMRMPGLTGLLGGILGGGGFSPTAGGFASMLGIPGRATGGPVAAGKPYIVGERRPELFVPDVPGRIVPRVPSVAGMAAGRGGGPAEVRVVVETNDPMFKARVESISGGVSAKITREGFRQYEGRKQREQLTRG